MSLQTAFARAPTGVLVIGTLLLLFGAGLILAAAVLLFSGRPVGWLLWSGLLASGPLAMYLALSFIHGRRWAWVTVTSILVLLLVSALVRALTSPEIPVAPFGEIVVSLGSLVYLTRAHVRRGFTE
jgi:hypothetical protein